MFLRRGAMALLFCLLTFSGEAQNDRQKKTQSRVPTQKQKVVKPKKASEAAENSEENGDEAPVLPKEWVKPTEKATEQMERVVREFLTLLKNPEVPLEMVGSACAVRDTMGEKRRDQWNRFMQRMRLWLANQEVDADGNLKVEILDSFMTPDYGGFLLGMVDAQDVLNMDVFPVLLVRRSQQWEVAPFVTALNNTDISLQDNKIAELAGLEKWLAQHEKDYYAQFFDLLEGRYKTKVQELRQQLQCGTKNFPELVDMWISAMQAGKTDEVVALGYKEENKKSPYLNSYKKVREFVLKKDKDGAFIEENDHANLVFSQALTSPLCFYVMDVDPNDAQKITLKIVNFSYQYFNEFYGELSLEGKLGPEGVGLEIIYPRDLESKRQGEAVRSNERFDHNSHIESVHQVLETVLKNVVPSELKSADEFVEYFISLLDDERSNVQKFLPLFSSKIKEKPDSFHHFMMYRFYPITEMLIARQDRKNYQKRTGVSLEPKVNIQEESPDQRLIRIEYGTPEKELKVNFLLNKEGDNWYISEMRD